MEGHELDLGQLRCGGHGTGDRVRYVVKLKVEEDAEALVAKLLHHFWTFGREELASYLEQPCYAAEPLCQSKSWPRAVIIEGND